MSEAAKSLDKLFSFLLSANMGFVLLFLLAIYPVYMWGVAADLKRIPQSIAYNADLIAAAFGHLNSCKNYGSS